MLLRAFCEAEPKVVAGIGLECRVRALDPAFNDIIDNTFHPVGVTFGHFLGPASEDAAVNGWSAETHPYRWGGTLLLTKRDAKWKPLWYKSALIVHSCEKMATPDSREILLCEDEDGGMGHRLHYLYAVDLRHPADLGKTLLTRAESFEDSCTVQQQIMDAVHWMDQHRGFSVTVRTTEWRRGSVTDCWGIVATRPPSSVRLQFAVANDGVQIAKAR